MDSLQAKPIEALLIQFFLEPSAQPPPEIVVHSREMTGVGFFTKFAVAARLRERTSDELPNGPMRGPEIVSAGLRHGAGSLLWPESSGVHMLEVYTYDEPFPNELGEPSFRSSSRADAT